MLTPIFLPVAIQLGIGPIHYGAVIVATQGSSVFLSPVSVSLLMACSVAGVPDGPVLESASLSTHSRNWSVAATMAASDARSPEIGADHNASGTAAVIAPEAFAANPVRPKQSVPFLAFDAEENGLLGAFHYAR